MQLPCSIRVDLNIQFLSIFTQQVSKNKQVLKQMIPACFICPEEGRYTLAPRCKSPLSWRWPCRTTCPSAARSHWTDVSGLACWSLGSPHCPERPRDVEPAPLEDCPGYRRTYLHGVGFSWPSLSVCKYADVIAINAGRHQRLDLLKHLMEPINLLQMLPWHHVLHVWSVSITSSCVAWGWKTLSISKARTFPLFSTLSEDSLLGSVVTATDWPSLCCWSSFNTGFTRHSTRMLPANTESRSSRFLLYGRGICDFSAYLWVPPAARGTSCAVQPLSCISQEDLCWPRTSRQWLRISAKQNGHWIWFLVHTETKTWLHMTTHLFLCITYCRSIKVGEVSNLAPQTGIVGLHAA